MKLKGYRVVAGYVTVETAVPGGRAEVDIPRGDMLPADVPQAQIDRDLAAGAIVEVVAAAEPVLAEDDAPPPPPPADAVEVPAGMSVSATEDWVKEGGDDALERARLALEAELAAGELARKTLVARLESVIAAADNPPPPANE